MQVKFIFIHISQEFVSNVRRIGSVDGLAPKKRQTINWTSDGQGHSWWRHQMETFSALLAISAGNSPHKGQWRGALMFFFYLRLNKRLSKQSLG